ncbi:MAG TPA: hypothetical protein VHO91_20665, partial [Rhodopila sp.]|nr:hypothetical protein [Rhodopila sp.]
SQWLFDAIKRQVGLAAGCAVDRLVTTESDALRAWIAASRSPEAADAHWASVYDELPDSPEVDRLILSRLRGRFCIGYEMPPWLVRMLDCAGIPYVDIRLHPVRFMDDLMFAVRASVPVTHASLHAMAVQEAEVIATAGLREAMGCYISDANMPDDTLLVAGQRRFDSTQIAGGRFFDAVDQAAEVHAVCARYSAVVLKPHPLDRYHSLLIAAAGAPARVLGVIDDNIYRLLALPQIRGVLTVNSGVAQEAGYFGKQVHTLAPPPFRPLWRERMPDAAAHVSLTDVVLTPDFWRIVLAPHMAVTKLDGMRLPAKPNRLRIALDSFWNYQQIDTDRIPRG